MYQDAGYGDNWQPAAANNARRFDPYNRSYAMLGCFFAVGFVLIIIVVLSLIPVYMSHNSSNSNYIQASRVFINEYTLQFRSPSSDFNPQTILSESKNHLALQAALTSMIQDDLILAGSVVEIDKSSLTSRRKRRQTSTLSNIAFNVYITSGKSCASTACSNAFQADVIEDLSGINLTTSFVRCEQSITNITTQIYWIQYQLPNTIQSNLSYVSVDQTVVASLLGTLLNTDKTLNQASYNASTLTSSSSTTSTATLTTNSSITSASTLVG